MTRFAKRFLILALCTLTSAIHAKSAPLNSPSTAQYSYQDSPECFISGRSGGAPNTEDSHIDGFNKLSALSGFSVGPTARMISNNRLDQPILRPFFSDGCSVSPDGIPATSDARLWAHCCVRHDSRYWAGGSEQDKIDADNELERCISDASEPSIGKIYKLFVAQFGGPMSTQSYRWGYGWNYRRPYKPLSQDEEKQVEALYHESLSVAQEELATTTHQLKRMCDTYDPVFQGISAEELRAYEFLNLTLHRDDQIEWAHWGNFNLERRELEIKLMSCDSAIKLIYSKTSAELLDVDTSGAHCSNLAK
jgi:hypothetical protein